MSRIAQTLMPDGYAFGQGVNIPIADLQFSGQMGYAPDLTEWVGNQAYVRRNLIALLVEAPTAFSDLPNPDYWVGTLRALVELHPLSITGLQSTLTVDTVDGNPVGGGGQVQEEFTDVKESRSQPQFRWNEKYGMPINRFLRGWIQYCIMDPNSKVASINTIAGNNVTDMLPDRYTMTVAFLEPDPTHTKINKSWLVTNMFPKSSGEVTGQRDLNAGGEIVAYDVEFAGIAQFGLGVDAFCQMLLNGINITGANPYERAPFVDQIAADVQAAGASYNQNVLDTAAGADLVRSGLTGSDTLTATVTF
jgi:hypothetical protein